MGTGDWAVSKRMMKRKTALILSICMALVCIACSVRGKEESGNETIREENDTDENEKQMNDQTSKLLYMGQASIRIITLKERLIFNGKDITKQVEEVWSFLAEHAFVM